MVSAFALAALLASGPAFAAPDPLFDHAGPIPSMDWNPMHGNFIQLEPETALTLPDGKAELRLNTGRTNSMEGVAAADGGRGLLHAETTRMNVEFHFGLPHGLEGAVIVPAFQRGDPVMDPAADWVERATNARMAARIRYEGTPMQFELAVPGKGVVRTADGGFGTGDLYLTLKKTLVDETRFAPTVAVRAGLKLPTGRFDLGFGSDTVDAAFGLAVQKSLLPWLIAYGNASAAKPLGGNPYLRSYTSASAALEVMLARDFSIIGQVESFSSPYAGTGNNILDGRDDLVLLGCRIGDVRAFASENLVFDNGLWARSADDFTVGTAVVIPVDLSSRPLDPPRAGTISRDTRTDGSIVQSGVGSRILQSLKSP